MKKALIFGLIALLVMAFASCAAGPNNMVDTEDGEGDVAGFWNGLWHGIITPFAFIISLFTDKVNVYEVHNNGNWYNFGFVFGLTIIFGGSGGGAGRGRGRRRS